MQANDDWNPPTNKVSTVRSCDEWSSHYSTEHWGVGRAIGIQAFLKWPVLLTLVARSIILSVFFMILESES